MLGTFSQLIQMQAANDEKQSFSETLSICLKVLQIWLIGRTHSSSFGSGSSLFRSCRASSHRVPPGTVSLVPQASFLGVLQCQTCRTAQNPRSERSLLKWDIESAAHRNLQCTCRKRKFKSKCVVSVQEFLSDFTSFSIVWHLQYGHKVKT